MRINVYTEELLSANDAVPFAEIVTADYVSSRTGEQMTNYGLRIFLKSPPELHYIPGRDDDRSAVTFWCGPSKKNVFVFLDIIHTFAKDSDMKLWRKKTEEVNKEAIKAERLRKLGEAARTADPDCKYCDGTGLIWKGQVGGGDWEQCSCLTIARFDGTLKDGDKITGVGYREDAVIVVPQAQGVLVTGPRHPDDRGRMIPCLDYYDGKCHAMTHICVECPDREAPQFTGTGPLLDRDKLQDTFGGPRPTHRSVDGWSAK